MRNYIAGQQFLVGPQRSTLLPDFDFETYSAAGYYFDGLKYRGLTKNSRGLGLVGAAAYAEHETTQVLSVAYDLKSGEGSKLWVPGMPDPQDLFDHISEGGLIEAHNSMFEFLIWHYVCVPRMGWPELPLQQLRCSMSKAKAYSLPGGLDNAARVVNCDQLKDSSGTNVMRKLSVPRNPTKADKSLKWTPEKHPSDFNILYAYNVQDIRAEESLSVRCPDLQPQELELWLLDQRINFWGVAIDTEALESAKCVFEQASEQYCEELKTLTNGRIDSASKVKETIAMFAEYGVYVSSLDEEAVEELLARPNLPPWVRRVGEIREMMASSSVKKLYSISHRLSSDNRVRGLFAFCGADRTGRFAGRGPQPQNLPNSGPKVKHCVGCDKFYLHDFVKCPHCGEGLIYDTSPEWSAEAVEDTIQALNETNSLSYIEKKWGNAVYAIAGCLRGLFVPAKGHDFICSDYSAIEGVVAAMLSGEQWRVDVFRSHGKIYEMGASKLTGIPFEEMIEYKKRTGDHHPSRKKLGKISELASGFGGWINAWIRFGAGEYMDEDEIKKAILAWRAASPNIVEMWGGQHRKDPNRWHFEPELFGLEGCVVKALLTPGTEFAYRGITYHYSTSDNVLYCRLLSGRYICYHKARLTPHIAKNGMNEYKITYEGCSETKSGGWVTMETYGGKLFENVVQATARDILANAMLNLDVAGYAIVLHVHDEVIAEVPEGTGYVEEFERIMAIMPDWASDWPIKAAGGWRGKRYRKD